MVNFAGKTFGSVADLLSAGSAVALGALIRKALEGKPVPPEDYIDELRRLALENTELFDHAYELGRMAGEINCVWRRLEAYLNDPEESRGGTSLNGHVNGHAAGR